MAKQHVIHDDSRIQEHKPPSRSRAYSLTHDKAGNVTNNLNDPPDQTTRRYIGAGRGGTGIWQNSNGTQIGRSVTEDSDIMPSKSTGDLANAIHIHLHTPDWGSLNTMKAAKMRNKQKGK